MLLVLVLLEQVLKGWGGVLFEGEWGASGPGFRVVSNMFAGPAAEDTGSVRPVRGHLRSAKLWVDLVTLQVDPRRSAAEGESARPP